MPAFDVVSWLREIGLERYARVFAAHDIDGTALPMLGDADLRELGVRSLGHRKKLLAAIANLSATSLHVQRAGARVEPSEITGERRTVSVLFCDITGFTRLANERDPEETHALLNDYFEIVDATVQLYGGHVDKHIGDAVMAIFGAPVAHTNDPERAVRAAFHIRRAVANLRPPVQVHIGIASGSVVVAGSHVQRAFTVTGPAVNLASGLQDLAGTGEILVSESVHHEVARWVSATSLDDASLKGQEEHVRVWRLDGLRPAATSGPRAAFVGRQAEVERFAALWSALVRRGAGSVLYVRGEAGIGKTRLVEELCVMAAMQGAACHRALVLGFGDGAGQGAIAELTCSLLGVQRTSTPREQRRAVAHALVHGCAARHRDAFLYDLLELTQSPAQRARYEAIPHAARVQGKRETLGELAAAHARDQPQLIIIEDVHWGDAEVIGYIEHLARVATGIPMLLVVTARLPGDPLAALRARGEVPLTAMDLQPIPTRDALLLARHLASARTRLVTAYVERAGGNPLFLEQLLRNAEDTPEAVPDSIQSIVQARIDSLSPQDRLALQTASIMGQRFSLDALRFLLDDPHYTCDALIEHHIIQRVAEGEYLFTHALVLEAVYSSLLRPRQKQLHTRAAAWFAGISPLLHAEHLERAGDPGAPHAYLDAARGQAEEYRFERAADLCERGLTLLEGAGEARESGPRLSARAHQALAYELTCLRGDILRKLGDVQRSMDEFERASTLADSELERCRAWIGLAEGMRLVDRNDEALIVLERAEAVAAQHERVDQLAQIHYLRGSLLFPRGDLDGCLYQHMLARDFAIRAGSPELEARALSGLGDTAFMRGHLLTAHRHFDECIALCQAHGLTAIEVSNLPMRSITSMWQNQVESALKDAAAAAEAAVMLGNKRAEIVTRSGALGCILLETGRLAEARVELEKALELVQAVGARRFEPLALIFLAKLEAEEARHEKARAAIEQALEACHATGFTFLGASVLGALAAVTRDPDERESALARGEDSLRSGMPGHNHVFFYRDAMDACLRAQDTRGVERYADALAAYTCAEPLPWAELLIARGRALAAHQRGTRTATLTLELGRVLAATRAAGLVLLARSLERALAPG